MWLWRRGEHPFNDRIAAALRFLLAVLLIIGIVCHETTPSNQG
jgi:hypothetical protein